MSVSIDLMVFLCNSEETVEARQQHEEGYVYFRNFLINLSIFILVVLFFVYISRFYRSTPAPAPLTSRTAKVSDATELMEAKAN